jgi:hypothetical protein
MPAAPDQTATGEHEDEAAVLDTLALDAGPGRDTNWPSPVSEKDEEPEDPDAELALAALANDEDYLNACRVCPQCRTGAWDECENLLIARDSAAIEDRVGEWLQLAWASRTVALPAIRVEEANPVNGRWYEVSGYTLQEGSVELILRPAWRQDEALDTFPEHADLGDGDPVDIEVGPERAGHRGNYRVLYRMKGGVRVGRFALRTKTKAKPVDLDASADGLPNWIEGHAVRRATAVSDTLTFVPNDLTLGLVLDLPLLTLDEATAKYVLGSSLWMIVSGVLPNGSRAFLRASDGTEGTVAAKDLGATDLSLTIRENEFVYATVRGVGERNGRVQLQVGLRNARSEPSNMIPVGPGQPGMLDVVLPAAKLTAPVPPHWKDILSGDAGSLETKLGATSLSLLDDQIVATFDTDESARAGAAALDRAVGLPAVSVVVDPSKAGLVIGRSGESIRAASAEPGVWFYDYDPASHTVRIVAETFAVVDSVSALVGKVAGSLGRLSVGAENTPRLIGKGHSRVNSLLADSGCSSARPLRSEPDTWVVQGPSSWHIARFIELACRFLPDLTGEVTEETVAFVTDLVTGTAVDDIDGHVWGRFEGGGASIDFFGNPGAAESPSFAQPSPVPSTVPPPASLAAARDHPTTDRTTSPASGPTPSALPPQPVIRDRTDSCTIWDLRDGYYLIRRDRDQMSCRVPADDYRNDPRPLAWLERM